MGWLTFLKRRKKPESSGPARTTGSLKKAYSFADPDAVFEIDGFLRGSDNKTYVRLVYVGANKRITIHKDLFDLLFKGM